MTTFRGQVQDLLQPGKAAVVMMAEKITEDRFAERMAPYGGHLLKTSLSEQDEKELADDLGAADDPRAFDSVCIASLQTSCLFGQGRNFS